MGNIPYTHIDCDLTDETELVLHRDDILSGGCLCHHAQSYLGFAFALCCVVLCCVVLCCVVLCFVVDLESCMLSCPGISVGEQSAWVGVPGQLIFP